MRNRKEIETDFNNIEFIRDGYQSQINSKQDLIIEVLLDIRDMMIDSSHPLFITKERKLNYGENKKD
jgi:hypothetical protein